MKKAWKYFIFVAVIDITFLLAFEFFLRLINPIPTVLSATTRRPPSMPWGWSNVPNRTAYVAPPVFTKRLIEIKTQTDELGYRNKGFTTSKPSGEYRIICMGDSSPYGWGVSYQEMYSVVLGDLMKREFPHKKTATYSMGIPGHTIVQGYVLYREQIKSFLPDLIILTYGANDWHDIAESNHPLTHRKYYLDEPYQNQQKEKDLFIKKTYIYKLLRSVPFLFHKHVINNKFLKAIFFQESGIPAVGLRDFEDVLELWVSEAKSDGTIVVVLRIGGTTEYADLMLSFSIKEKIPFLDYQEIVEEHFEEIKHDERFEKKRRFYTDAIGEQVIEESNYEYLYTLDGVHPTSIGHQLIAEELLTVVKKMSAFQNH